MLEVLVGSEEIAQKRRSLGVALCHNGAGELV
jgi:hypothetical protein